MMKSYNNKKDDQEEKIIIEVNVILSKKNLKELGKKFVKFKKYLYLY